MAASIEILVGMDGSPGAARALRWAIEEAAARPARVTAVMAWSYLDQRREPDGPEFDPAYDEQSADRVLARYIVDVVGADAANTIGRRPINDLPARALLTAAAAADLLVLGTRGMGGFKGLLVGSVTQQLVAHSPCPLVVVPPPA